VRIVVTGLAATFPLGGVFWDYLQYAIGFHRLGHHVLYVEDTGQWCYDPVAQTFSESGAANARAFADSIDSICPELSDSWFFRDAGEGGFGIGWAAVADFCRSADLFINISAACLMREEYAAAGTVAFIDSDPMYTQAAVPDYLAGRGGRSGRANVEQLLRNHDVHFTFAENIGAPDCKVPTEVFDWRTTRQPIVLDRFRASRVPVEDRRPVFTTEASWKSREGGVKIGDDRYGGKSSEFLRFLELPSRVDQTLEVAMSGRAPRSRLKSAGWQIVDAAQPSAGAAAYRAYLADSIGEFSVAKHAYVASRSGWFSCRSACYLALGVPVVVQDTGFPRFGPEREGVLRFSDMEEAADAIERVARDPARHARAAAAVAEEHFDSNRILTRLLEDASASRSPTPAARRTGVG
jgi:hypothetical protein